MLDQVQNPVLQLSIIIQRPTKNERYRTLQSCVGLQEQWNQITPILLHRVQSDWIQKRHLALQLLPSRETGHFASCSTFALKQTIGVYLQMQEPDQIQVE